ncbi:tRNA lysidine(34) synthetase TilS, partial [Sediminibacterium sp.]|uniref:tRNA lysidine(34) synthetase TilS n=1 Tax=Sediminibacterium sp. TaxID=1917865 RepID=UPI003F694FD5
MQKPGRPFLLAMSGGADSTVLAILLQSLGVEFKVAHVNYQLRGEESYRDENFVVSFCKKHSIGYWIKRVDTLQYKNETGLSTQVAARNIRYEWFDQLRNEHAELADSWIITAHHANDAIETSAMHFFRGTGLEGLKGIVAVHADKKIIRPLLPFFKEEIESFAGSHSIEFVKD